MYVPILVPGVETSKRVVRPFIIYKIQVFKMRDSLPPVDPLMCWQHLCPQYSLNTAGSAQAKGLQAHSHSLRTCDFMWFLPALHWGILATSRVQGPQTQMPAPSAPLRSRRPPCARGLRQTHKNPSPSVPCQPSLSLPRINHGQNYNVPVSLM